MIEPPPLDPLDGLEVVVEGTFTVGKLRMVPSRRLRTGKNMFDTQIVVKEFEGGSKVSYAPTTDDDSESDGKDNEEETMDLAKIQAEAEAAEKEAEAAAAEAKRKAEKMEMLKKRAEEAMARRKQKKQ